MPFQTAFTLHRFIANLYKRPSACGKLRLGSPAGADLPSLTYGCTLRRGRREVCEEDRALQGRGELSSFPFSSSLKREKRVIEYRGTVTGNEVEVELIWRVYPGPLGPLEPFEHASALYTGEPHL